MKKTIFIILMIVLVFFLINYNQNDRQQFWDGAVQSITETYDNTIEKIKATDYNQLWDKFKGEVTDLGSRIFGTDSNNASASVNEDDIDVSANREIEVAACDLSGTRDSNVKVDIGYDSNAINREYYGYTNQAGQLVKVEADELILQDDDLELASGKRYCKDEAKVPGVESATLDEGHAIADSLGGVSNAYNITPQDSVVNRSGEQATMEEELRDALQDGREVTDFLGLIEYEDDNQIPTNYYFEYKVDGEPVNWQFANE